MKLREGALLALLPLLASCGNAAPGIDSVSPAEGSARGGEAITLAGRFGPSPVVHLGGERAKVTSATDGEIEIVSPHHVAGAVDIEVESEGETTRLPSGFTYLALPFAFADMAWSRLGALPVRGAGAAMADANGDGKLDIFQAAGSEGAWVHPGAGKGSFGEARRIPPGEAPADVHSLIAADLDDDGHVDLLLGTTGKTRSLLLLGDGKLGFDVADGALPPLFGAAMSGVAVDLDGDDDLDLVFTGAATAADGEPGVVILENDGRGAFTDVTDEHLGGGAFAASGVAAGDVDGDGDPDLFFGGDTAPCRLYLNDGKGALSLSSPDALPHDPAPGAATPALGDLDGDGSIDVYLPTSGQDRVLLNDGEGRFTDLTDVVLGPESATGRSAVITDLDLDGHADVAVIERPGRLRLYRNDGSGRLFDYSGEAAGNGAGLDDAALAVGDVDGDGDDDIFVSRGDLRRAALFVSLSPLPLADRDSDGVADVADSCPAVPNPAQENLDSLPFRCASAASCHAETGCELVALGGSAYLFCRDASVGWAAAEAACVARGAHLVTIESAAENAALAAIAGAAMWIGYSDAATEGAYVWASGKGSYASWGEGQPDDAGGNEDCAALGADGAWNDLPCDAARPFLCEDVRVRVPDPGDACDACPTIHEPDSEPVGADAGTCGGGGTGGAGP